MNRVIIAYIYSSAKDKNNIGSLNTGAYGYRVDLGLYIQYLERFETSNTRTLIIETPDEFTGVILDNIVAYMGPGSVVYANGQLVAAPSTDIEDTHTLTGVIMEAMEKSVFHTSTAIAFNQGSHRVTSQNKLGTTVINDYRTTARHLLSLIDGARGRRNHFVPVSEAVAKFMDEEDELMPTGFLDSCNHPSAHNAARVLERLTNYHTKLSWIIEQDEFWAERQPVSEYDQV